MISLSDIKQEFNKHLLIKDPFAIDLIFASVMCNIFIPQGRIWLMLVGASGGGKTSLVDPLQALLNETYFFLTSVVYPATVDEAEIAVVTISLNKKIPV